MKVKQLIDLLEKYDRETDVLCYTEEEAHLSKRHGFRLFDIESIDIVEAEKRRGEDQVPSLKFGKSDLSEKHVIIQIISDF